MLDCASEYGFEGQFVHMSLATAMCSEPVSRMTRTGLPGEPTKNVPIMSPSAFVSIPILICFSPIELVMAFLLYIISSSVIIAELCSTYIV